MGEGAACGVWVGGGFEGEECIPERKILHPKK